MNFDFVYMSAQKLIDNTNFIECAKMMESLSDQDAQSIMVANKTKPLTLLFRKILVFVILKGYPDIHIDTDDSDVLIGATRVEGSTINISVDDGDSFLYLDPFVDAQGDIQELLVQKCKLTGGNKIPIQFTGAFNVSIPYDIAVKSGLKPQDGKRYGVKFRVECIQTVSGRSFTCRLVDPQRAPTFDNLIIPSHLKSVFDRMISQQSGFIVISGPTGSGKSTALNAIIQKLNDGSRCIYTIENPVEYPIPFKGASVIAVEVFGDLSFLRALRSAMRSSPHLILIGEIRDEQTMQAALDAASTGHLVFATVHANDAHSTLERMHELGADAARLAQVTSMVIAQRLLTTYSGPFVDRRLSFAEQTALASNGIYTQVVHESTGPKKGKIPVLETIVFDDKVQDAIRSNSEHFDAVEVYKSARGQTTYESLMTYGMRCVEEHGCRIEDVLKLHPNPYAKDFPSFRLKMAKEYAITFVTVQTVVDAYYEGIEDRAKLTIEEFFESYFNKHQSINSSVETQSCSILEANTEETY